MKILDCTLRDGGFKCDFNWILDTTRSYLFDMVKKEWFDNIFVYKKSYRGDDGFYKPSSVTFVCSSVRRTFKKKVSHGRPYSPWIL